MMKKVSRNFCSTAVALICNRNYIVPTLGAAMSARENISDQSIRVIVYVIDSEIEWECKIKCSIDSRDIEVEVSGVNIADLENVAKFHADRYLPSVTLARFWLHEFLPDGIDKFLYLDGDTLVTGSLDELLAMNPAPGKIIAAPDNVQLFSGEISRSRAADEKYFSNISTSRDRYFNAGVLLVSTKTWREKSKQALSYLMQNSDICRSSDQSALNHVFRNDQILISQFYNYQTEHMMVSPRTIGEAASPTIYHFTGGPKPWDEAIWPWNNSFNEVYAAASEVLSSVADLPPVSPEAQTKAGKLHRSRYRMRQTFIYPWRRYLRELRLKRLESLSSVQNRRRSVCSHEVGDPLAAL